MAAQLNRVQVRALIQELLADRDAAPEKIRRDGPEGVRYRMAFAVAKQLCENPRLDLDALLRVVLWRDDAGQPDTIEVQWDRRAFPARRNAPALLAALEILGVLPERPTRG